MFGGGQKVIRLRGSVPYEAASSGRRTALWNPVGDAINALTAGNVDSLRTKSRDLMRKNPWALSALDSYVANAIGTGIKPKSKHPDPVIKKHLQELWLDWTDEADSAGLTDFYGLQALALRSVMEGGDVIVRFRPRLTSDGLTVPLQLQVLESEHLPSTKFELTASGNVIRAGIEFDKIGRRVAYHLYREHPGDRFFFQANDLTTVPVPASSALLMMRPLRPGQLRGIPWLAIVLMRLYELDKFDDAELMKQQVAALFAGFIEKANAEDSVFGTEETSTETDGALVQGLEPATMQELPLGSKVTFSNPPQHQTYEVFMRNQLRSIAAGS